MSRDKEQLFQVSLGEDASLDVIKLEDMSVLFVISERGSVQRRTVATLGAHEAIKMAKFIVGIKEIGDE
jgi:hypothetical protein